MPRHRLSLRSCTAPLSCSLQHLLKLSLLSLRPSLLQLVSIVSPHSPSLRFGLPAPQPSRRHHARSLLDPSFHDPGTIMFSNPTPSEPRLSLAATMSHLQPKVATLQQIVAFFLLVILQSNWALQPKVAALRPIVAFLLLVILATPPPTATWNEHMHMSRRKPQ